jgi:hypothetical protein
VGIHTRVGPRTCDDKDAPSAKELGISKRQATRARKPARARAGTSAMSSAKLVTSALSPIEMRKMEFDAVRKIMAAMNS